MANIMSIFRAKNKVTRDGYDLSKRLCFTAKAGELLPVYSRIMMQGDKFNMANKWMTRTAPVNTAAYTRFREYYDWFFVPLNLLWDKYNVWSVNMKDNVQTATSINQNLTLTDKHPYLTTQQIVDYLTSIRSNTLTNQFGFERYELTCKLLHYLGYGDFYHDSSSRNPWYFRNIELSPWRLLAYQKIYQDYFRNTQWERSRPETCNINYVTGNAIDLQLPLSDIDTSRTNMFDLQYCNWNKDLFMGLLPNSQYGDAASIVLDGASSDGSVNPNGVTLSSDGLNIGSTNYLSMNKRSSSTGSAPWFVKFSQDNGKAGAYDADNVYGGEVFLRNFYLGDEDLVRLKSALGLSAASSVQSSFTILALRQAEALQKLREIQQANPQDFPAQSEAHFGYRPSNAYSQMCRRVGGVSGDIEINPVVNNNITENEDSSLNSADIAGMGTGVGSGSAKDFVADVPGVLMCIYHVVPLLDYALTGVAPDNAKTLYTDYAIPEMDKTGMMQVPLQWLFNSPSLERSATGLTAETDLLGYAPNYIDYKTDIDEVKGAFYNGGLESWVAPITREYIENYLFGDDLKFTGIDYHWMKVNPSVTDSIFSGQNVNSSVATDKFWVNCYINVKGVRPLDADGLPY